MLTCSSCAVLGNLHKRSQQVCAVQAVKNAQLIAHSLPVQDEQDSVQLSSIQSHMSY